ncbi:MAG: fumarylacetoacetate hydrolase family protein [Planctomycetales bacterium]|nr:fumarylacetoacetate hydrolase family protein [Planctomycetales bacterium]MCA9167252.1 fumarylacetoacetate hydrolase family protein [Planctomycetales bacterium]
MKLIKYLGRDGRETVGILSERQGIVPLRFETGHVKSLADLLELDEILPTIDFLRDDNNAVSLDAVKLLPPIDQQEVWAAGVTYKRSKAARMEESEAAASCYDRVYVSPRPELFLKATPHRVVGHGGAIRIRSDSCWNVPEPELTLVMNSRMRLVGMTVGNDVSSRDIEGENPLYLPQAKVYNESCSLGPCICLIESMPPREEIQIRLRVVRGKETVYQGSTAISEMARTFEDLIHWLGRDNSFPCGVMLMTGTGIVPDREFTMMSGDHVEIDIDGIGTLRNSVVQG